jgi:hypothetical protein
VCYSGEVSSWFNRQPSEGVNHEAYAHMKLMHILEIFKVGEVIDQHNSREDAGHNMHPCKEKVLIV